jgi:DNA polymerase/3'-5' exonuclease PolX
MTDKPKFPYHVAGPIARALLEDFKRFCEHGGLYGGVYCMVAGSLRRLKSEVGDIELVYVPKIGMAQPQGEIFAKQMNLVDRNIMDALDTGELVKRLNVNGNETFGGKIKLLTHVASGIPVDFFETTKESWWNYLVCRTGPKESNTRIAMAAQAMNPKWKWEPYSPGFKPVHADGDKQDFGRSPIKVTSEREVFEFVGLPYLRPEDRE